jgi:hypothetical protein
MGKWTLSLPEWACGWREKSPCGGRAQPSWQNRNVYHKQGIPAMPQGDKSSYTAKQKRQAAHIEEGYENRGVPESEAERRAWATVNKVTGGGKKSGSGRGNKH